MLVRRTLTSALLAMPPGPIRLLSVCAGDGRDVLGVLEHHPRAREVEATLVDADAELVAAARTAAADLGLHQVRCVVGDAGRSTWYEAVRPLDLLVACGVLGNISSQDQHTTLRAFGTAVRPGGHLIWTRHRRAPDQTPQVRRWLRESGFEEVAFEPVEGSLASVGWHRRTPQPATIALPERLFDFVGDGSGAHA